MHAQRHLAHLIIITIAAGLAPLAEVVLQALHIRLQVCCIQVLHNHTKVWQHNTAGPAAPILPCTLAAPHTTQQDSIQSVCAMALPCKTDTQAKTACMEVGKLNGFTCSSLATVSVLVSLSKPRPPTPCRATARAVCKHHIRTHEVQVCVQVTWYTQSACCASSQRFLCTSLSTSPMLCSARGQLSCRSADMNYSMS